MAAKKKVTTAEEVERVKRHNVCMALYTEMLTTHELADGAGTNIKIILDAKDYDLVAGGWIPVRMSLREFNLFTSGSCGPLEVRHAASSQLIGHVFRRSETGHVYGMDP